MANNYITYISRFFLQDYKSFKGENEFNLLNEDKELVQWTVILGNNNTGKTNLLKALADLEPKHMGFSEREEKNRCAPLNLVRSTQSADDIDFTISKKDTFIGCDFIYKKRGVSKSHLKGTFTPYGKPNPKKKDNRPNWGFTPFSMWQGGDFNILSSLLIYGYGVTRRTGSKGLSDKEEYLNSQTLFNPEKSLINIEEWLLQLDYSSKNDQKLAKSHLKKIKSLVKSEVFPEITDFKFNSSKNLKNRILFKTNAGWHKLEDLGYGYQTTLSWMIDLCKKMFERYPQSSNPLEEPAVVLIDEIDLHLHPSWQKDVVKYLSNIFPSTQFIVTTHSPLVIQSLESLNLFVLTKTNDEIRITKSKKTTFKGWSIEEILQDLMELENSTYSDSYNELFAQFDKALDQNNYKSALTIYNKLDNILHPNSAERKILKLQMSQLENND